MLMLRNCQIRMTLAFILAVIATGASAREIETASALPIDAFMAQDAPYSWRLVETRQEQGYEADILRLDSQTWRSPDEVTPTEWRHWVTVIRPQRPTGTTALLFVNGGRHREEPPDGIDSHLLRIAMDVPAVVVDLSNVPHQPLFFPEHPNRQRFEDDILAYGMSRVMVQDDPTWLAHFAMARSAVRAMDAVQEHLNGQGEDVPTIEQFVVTGASKRGWTSWLTAIADQRVVAVMPIVIDLLNMEASMMRHYGAYGFFAPTLRDYVYHNIVGQLDTPELAELFTLIDPFVYPAERLSIPKFILNSAGDQFFLPDSSQFYFRDLPGERHLRYVPNTGHGLEESDAAETLMVYFASIVHDRPRPNMTWELQGDRLTVSADTAPTRVRLWQADNPAARDFRVDRLGRAYAATDLEARPDNTVEVRLTAPERGWRACFVEMTFDSGFPVPYKFTTDVMIVPDVLPFENAPVENRLEPFQGR